MKVSLNPLPKTDDENSVNDKYMFCQTRLFSFFFRSIGWLNCTYTKLLVDLKKMKNKLPNITQLEKKGYLKSEKNGDVIFPA